MRILMRFSRVSFVFLAALALVSCSRDPNVAKRRYLESGNKYFEKGKYKEARLMYKDALQKDRLWGPAYYKLGLTETKLGSWGQAVQAFRRAIPQLPESSPDHWDARVKLSEILLIAAGDQKQYQDEIEDNANRLLKRDPNSFDGHRLTGDLDFRKALGLLQVAQRDDAKAMLATALQEFQKADAVKPGDPGVTLQMARTHAGMGDLADAERLYRQVLEKNKSHRDAYAELYKLYLFERKPEMGEQLLKTAVQNNPKDYSYLNALALHYAQQQRTSDMVAVLQQIKSHAKDYPEAYQVVGDFYLRLGDAENALKQYREGMDKDPKQKLMYQKRMIEVLMRQGKRSEAADITQQILKEDPNDNDAKGVAATLKLDKGEVNQALEDLTQVVTRAPNNPVARYNLGRAHEMRGEWELARQQFAKALEIRPDYYLAWMALAQLQVARGDFDAALKTADDILARDRTNPGALLIKSAAYIGKKKYVESRAVLDAMLKANPNSPDVYYQMGLLNLYERKFKDAEDTFRKSYDLNPTSARGLMGVVETYMAENKPDQALSVLQAESAKAPNRLEFKLAAGNVCSRAGKFDEAVGEYQKVLDGLDKNSKMRGEVYLRVGETYRRKGDDGAAIAALQKAREILPDNSLVLATLGLTLDHAGRWTEARKLYEATLQITPNNGIILNNLAFLMAEHSGDLDDALAKATKAKQLLPDMGEVSDTLGWIYLKKNLTDNAIEIFKNLTAKVPNQSTYRYHLGMAFWQKGDKTNCIKELQEALKNNPGQEEKRKIQDLLNRVGA
jgi:tetratricopeptide (TPR) repeat protein